jgi:transcription antitermination factor NusG
MTYLAATHKKWYVVVSRMRNYKKAAKILEKSGVSFYLPIQRQLHYWSDRKKWVDVPILNPYIFLFANEKERTVIFQTCNLFRFLISGGNPATAREDEVEKVRLLCNYSTNLKVEKNPIKKGDLVDVIGGPLSGLKGYTLQENGKHRFLVNILSLGQFVSVDIDSRWLSVF